MLTLPRISTILLALGLLWTACDTADPGLATEEESIDFAFKGALQKTFNPDHTAFEGRALFVPEVNRLDVTLVAHQRLGDAREDAQLVFHVPFDTNGLQPGDHVVRLDEASRDVGEAEYIQIEGDQRIRHSLEASDLTLRIHSLNEGWIVGSFTLRLDQRYGDRTIDGQTETVTLASSVRAEGRFVVPLDTFN